MIVCACPELDRICEIEPTMASSSESWTHPTTVLLSISSTLDRVVTDLYRVAALGIRNPATLIGAYAEAYSIVQDQARSVRLQKFRIRFTNPAGIYFQRPVAQATL